ncbi:MAG TPA: transcription antitermination factor NusB [Vicinamibacteria bacterium]
MTASARPLALETLRRLAQGRATLGDLLARPEPEALDPRERGFLHELVLGTLRRRGWIDHVLSGLASRPLDRLTPGVLDALRLGAYQLLYLRVPAHAAVGETVELARGVEPRSAGFANAVLRRLQREGPPPEPDAASLPLDWLTTAGSLPRWLAERWCRHLGPERAVARARALLDAPPIHVRLNPRVPDALARLEAEGVATRQTGVPFALEASGGRLAALAREGVLYVQDAGSQLVARLAAAGGLVLDACAAPGGKALLIADAGGPRTRVVAAEPSRRRVRTLARLRSLWGAENVAVVAADALRPPFARLFDVVLLDAPCSGLGTLGRNPDVRWRLGPDDVARHAERQRRLIGSVAPLVRPGGRLVYATCSLEPEENEGVVEPFLQEHRDFEADEARHPAEAFRDGPFVRIEPGAGGDGFFAVRLRRRGGEPPEDVVG